MTSVKILLKLKLYFENLKTVLPTPKLQNLKNLS